MELKEAKIKIIEDIKRIQTKEGLIEYLTKSAPHVNALIDATGPQTKEEKPDKVEEITVDLNLKYARQNFQMLRVILLATLVFIMIFLSHEAF